jgi:hypothetical protein
MRQTYTARQAAYAGTEPRGYKPLNSKSGPQNPDRRNGTSESGARLRMVPAPGGVAFVEDKPTSETSQVHR